jgi:hypothetical protein
MWNGHSPHHFNLTECIRKSRNFDSNDFPEELKFEMGQRYLHSK